MPAKENPVRLATRALAVATLLSVSMAALAVVGVSRALDVKSVRSVFVFVFLFGSN